MALFSIKNLGKFNELDYEVYNYIINNGDKVPYMTIRELADETHVSTTTITRFCRKTDCSGFSEFKIKLKLENQVQKQKQKGFDFAFISEFIRRADSETFQKQLKTAADIIASKDEIVFIGMGNSGVVAEYAARYFCSTGVFCTGISNPMFPINLPKFEESVVVVFSVEGETEQLITNIEKAKRNNCTIISITNSNKSTLAKVSSYNLSYFIQSELVPGKDMKIDITSQVPAVYISEMLAKMVAQQKM